MTLEQRLKEIRERCDAATKGPWEPVKDNDGDITQIQSFANVFERQTGCDEEDETYNIVCNLPVEKYGYGSAWDSKPNSSFIAHARTDVPMLLEMVEIRNEIVYCPLHHMLDWGKYKERLEKIAEEYNEK